MAAKPEVASVPEAVRVTGEIYQPFDPLTGGTDMERLGGVVSRLIVLEMVARFPAASLAWNSIPCTPSGILTVASAVHVPPSRRERMAAKPEVASEPEAVRATGDLYQPFDPSTGGTDMERFGGIVSRLIVFAMVVLFPAASLAWNSIPCTPSGTLRLSPKVHAPPPTR
jgi:hypothetical protein